MRHLDKIIDTCYNSRLTVRLELPASIVPAEVATVDGRQTYCKNVTATLRDYLVRNGTISWPVEQPKQPAVPAPKNPVEVTFGIVEQEWRELIGLAAASGLSSAEFIKQAAASYHANNHEITGKVNGGPFGAIIEVRVELPAELAFKLPSVGWARGCWLRAALQNWRPRK